MASAAFICYLMWKPLRPTYDEKHDSLRISVILVIAIIPSLFSMIKPNLMFFFYSYSLWVECVAILPQLLFLVRSVKFDLMDREYVFFLSIYRLFYLLNWIYKMVTETGKTPKVVWITGILQTVIYSDFIFEYFKARISGKSEVLPI